LHDGQTVIDYFAKRSEALGVKKVVVLEVDEKLFGEEEADESVSQSTHESVSGSGSGPGSTTKK
jgi:hypothetical protein